MRLELREVSRRFPGVTALDRLSLRVEAGRADVGGDHERAAALGILGGGRPRERRRGEPEQGERARFEECAPGRVRRGIDRVLAAVGHAALRVRGCR